MWQGSRSSSGQSLPVLPDSLRQHVFETMNKGKKIAVRIYMCNLNEYSTNGSTSGPSEGYNGRNVVMKIFISSVDMRGTALYPNNPDNAESYARSLQQNNMNMKGLMNLKSFISNRFKPSKWGMGMRSNIYYNNRLAYHHVHGRTVWLSRDELSREFERFITEFQTFSRSMNWELLPIPDTESANNCMFSNLYVLSAYGHLSVPMADS